jgi:tetrapyrrole methylase family protein / MazG family protein
MEPKQSNFDQFVATIARLRAPDGCPWDREQDHLTLARYLLEETYEVLEAIHGGDPAKLCDELGDLLLQIVLNAQVAKDNGEFDIQDVAGAINAKMIKRHPHVFGDGNAKTAGEVVKRWEEIKQEEAKEKEANASIIDSVPNALPALLKALKISEKAVSEGFEWRNLDEVWDKMLSELEELKAELKKGPDHYNKREVELELGDVLFTLVNIARWQKINPEESLLLAIEKFKKRYRKMEELSKLPLKGQSADDLNILWEQAKQALR